MFVGHNKMGFFWEACIASCRHVVKCTRERGAIPCSISFHQPLKSSGLDHVGSSDPFTGKFPCYVTFGIPTSGITSSPSPSSSSSSSPTSRASPTSSSITSSPGRHTSGASLCTIICKSQTHAHTHPRRTD